MYYKKKLVCYIGIRCWWYHDVSYHCLIHVTLTSTIFIWVLKFLYTCTNIVHIVIYNIFLILFRCSMTIRGSVKQPKLLQNFVWKSNRILYCVFFLLILFPVRRSIWQIMLFRCLVIHFQQVLFSLPSKRTNAIMQERSYLNN
jgi:hypothetical protein